MELAMQTVKQIWNTWDIRVLLIVSLLIQIFLTFLAPYRKRFVSQVFGFGIWVLYLSADAVALFAIGLISSSLRNSPKDSELLALWAPFLLLHLGGPDTITSLSLEDNELWLRHGLQFATQACVTVYVFIQSVRTNNRLWLPTVIMFIGGSVKYMERTCALYLSSSDSFKDSLVTINNTFINSIPWWEEPSDQPSPWDMLIHAYSSYTMFKGILVDSALSFEARDSSRAFFVGIAPQQAIKIIEIELNLINDVFFSKVSLLLRNKIYFISGRAVGFVSIVASLSLFNAEDKRKYHKTDVGITYYLLVGALLLDLYAALRFVVSDWWIIVRTFRKWHRVQSIPRRLHSYFASSQRWSQSISQYNLLSCCTHHLPSYFNWITFIQRVKDVLIGWYFVSSVPIHEKLAEFITEEIYKKVKLATEDGDATDEIRSARGNLVFQQEYSHLSDVLHPWTLDLDYDESVLTWHVATDICLRVDNSYQNDQNKDSTGEALYFQLSKQLSDYMLYIMLRQQQMVSSVAGFADFRFAQTVDVVYTLLEIHTRLPPAAEDTSESALQRLSTMLLAEEADDGSWRKISLDRISVISKAHNLAKQIQMLGSNKWEITSKVWVELLCYAAIRSSPRFQVVQLNAGGELITTVWLLLAHLGLAGQFQMVDRASIVNERKNLPVHYRHRD